jgi:hypothetical protein
VQSLVDERAAPDLLVVKEDVVTEVTGMMKKQVQSTLVNLKAIIKVAACVHSIALHLLHASSIQILGNWKLPFVASLIQINGGRLCSPADGMQCNVGAW